MKSYRHGTWARIALTAIISIVALGSHAASSTVFYVVAHPDDWQLFMSPNAYVDAQQTDVKVVLIYTTAGDAGCGNVQGCRVNPLKPTATYYLARENGALRAARFIGTKATEQGAYATLKSTPLINGHRITRYEYNNVVSYFLRLPDGNSNGDGFPGTGNKSLYRLRTGLIPSLTAITGTGGSYTWSNLVATLNAIVRKEATGSTNVWLNVPNTDTNENAGDHSDHIDTGLAATAAIASLPCINQARYLEYVTSSMPDNLSTDETLIEGAVYGVTVSGVIDMYAENDYEPEHNAWLGQRYNSLQFGNGSCTF